METSEPGLREAEDVVDEEQHVLLLHVAEVLRHGQRRQCDAQTRPRRLVHLAEDERRLVEDAGLFHLADEVVALTGALADTGEHRNTAVVLGDPLDHLLDQHRLADAGAAEQADLAALHVRGEQVDDLDAGLEHSVLDSSWSNAGGSRWIGQRSVISIFSPGLAFKHIADHVEHAALGDLADGHRDRRPGVAHFLAAHQTVGRVQPDRAHQVVAEVLGDLHGDLVRVVADRDRRP